MIRIERADCLQFHSRRRWRLRELVGYAKRPAGVCQHLFDSHAGMHRSQVGFAITAEPQDSQCGDQRGRPGALPESMLVPPAIARALARRGNVANALHQPAALVLKKDHGAACQARDVAGAAGARQADVFPLAVAPR